MEVSAQLNNFRCSPRKVRLVAKVLAGLDAGEAENQLDFLVKGSAIDFKKLLKSAIANAENNFGLNKDNLYIKNILVDEGVKLKRWLPRAYGRASLILKRTSHIKMTLAEKIEGKDRKKVEKQAIKDVKAEDLKKIESEKEEAKEEIKKEESAFASKTPADAKALAGKPEENKGFLRKVFRRKSM